MLGFIRYTKKNETNTYNKLVDWKNSSGRKPLILKGARQVGKTYLLNEFGLNKFPVVHYLNFQKNKELGEIFDGDVYPIEVKAGLSGKLKSLNVFSQKYNSPYGTRLSGRNLEINDSANMHSYPLYLAFKFPLR